MNTLKNAIQKSGQVWTSKNGTQTSINLDEMGKLRVFFADRPEETIDMANWIRRASEFCENEASARACKTIGCIAGTYAIMKEIEAGSKELPANFEYKARGIAEAGLNLTEQQASDLFTEPGSWSTKPGHGLRWMKKSEVLAELDYILETGVI